MQYKTILVACVGVAAATATTSTMTMRDNQFQVLPWTIFPPPSASLPPLVVERPLQPFDKEDILNAAARTKTHRRTIVTAAGHTLDMTDWLKLVPSPGPMPTSTLQFSTNMDAKLSSDVASNLVERLRPSTTGTILSSYIASLEQAESSAAASLSSLSRASLTESANRAKASEDIENAKKADKKLRNAASLILPSKGTAALFGIAFFCASVAFLL